MAARKNASLIGKRSNAGLSAELERLAAERDEALARERALAEMLQVINGSPSDLQPVFDGLLDRALRLCHAPFGVLFRYDGVAMHLAAMRGSILDEAALEWFRMWVPEPDSAVGQILKGTPSLHITDVRDTDAYRSGMPSRVKMIDVTGARTAMWVALRRHDRLLGIIVIYRQEVRPFTDAEIALVRSFADEAVIAMENARLLTETREALEQQTATSEILQVINASLGDLMPVFETILDKAHALCGAERGTLFLYDGEKMKAAVAHGYPADVVEHLRAGIDLAPHHAPLFAGNHVHIADLRQDGNATGRLVSERGGVRTNLLVPLFRNGALLGMVSCNRTVVRPFSDKEIALIENFAQQAIIAIENARLINEIRERTDDLQESLEYQTATSDVLQVISRSTFDLQPVLDTLVETATRLCVADGGAITIRETDAFRFVAVRGISTDLSARLRDQVVTADLPQWRGLQERIARDGIAHIADILAEPEFSGSQSATIGKMRTILAVPLLRDGAVVGLLHFHRFHVEPFTERQIDLVRTFADQALIAIENARLITETQDALDQQTATAEVLGVINASPGNLAPVFNAMLERAVRLCEADTGHLFRFENGAFFRLASRGVSEDFDELFPPELPVPMDPNSTPARMIATRSVVHVHDVREDESFTVHRTRDEVAAVEAGILTVLFVPLIKESEVVGHFTMHRMEVRPFTEKQISLLQNFAQQAVIAMENARLITETREALDQQTATAEVLGVINSSPGDLAPVFEVMVERAANLCEADEAAVRTFDGELLHLATTHGTDPTALERLRRLGATRLEGLYGPFARGDDIVHYVDARDTDAYRTHEVGRQRIDARGIRSWLAVALRKEGTLLGIINVHRREVRPFSEKQIALLQNFAAQAVIAIENARLLDQIRQRQAELRVTFDNMGDGVVMFDHELRLAAWNKNFQEILDLPDEILDQRKTYSEYLHILGERGEFGPGDVEEELNRRLAHAHEELRFERARPNGQILEVRRNAVAGGGFVLIYSDITERKRSEEQIRAARDAAEKALTELQAAQSSLVQAQKMAALGQLTAGIAHEIKNPLNFVNNFASLSTELLDELKEAIVEDKRDEIDETIEMLTGNLDKIVEHGQRADNIVKSMLDHSRGVSGERRAVNLNVLIDEALNLAYHGARAQDASFNVTLERNYAADLTPIELAPQEMTRVFLNLIGNGFYAVDKRAKANGDCAYRPTLRVATRESGAGIEVRVRDNGTGIPADIHDKLFQPFFTTKPTGEGTGLGLSISYDIVTQQHGGTIEVASEEGAYTEFTIRLPRYSGLSPGRRGAA